MVNHLKNCLIILTTFGLFSIFSVGCQEKEKHTEETKETVVEPLKTVRTKADNEEAIKNFQALIKKDPNNVILLISLGNAYFEMKMDRKAIVVYNRALKIYPGNVSLRTDLGTCYRRLGQPDKALNEYRKSLVINPRHSVTRYNMGVVLLTDKNDVKGAIAAWQELLRMDPYFIMAEEIRKNIMKYKNIKVLKDKKS